ncbi:MAG: MFS transporter [candidate division Zixibacteria bacterium]|nr:MFS transporter [candidate division Zixibacteria bacterium]
MNNSLKKAASYLGLKKSTSILLASIVAIGVGEHMWIRFIPKYLEILGASVFIIGLQDFIATALTAVYGYPGGVITDRFGLRRCLIFFTGLSIVGYIILLVFPGWPAVIIGMFFYLSWSNLSQPALFAFIGKALPGSKHVMGLSLISIVNRIPRTIGPIVGGALIVSLGFIDGIRVALLISILSGIGGILLIRKIQLEEIPSHPGFNALKLWRKTNRDWKVLLLSDIMARFCQRIPFAFVILYALNNIGIGAEKFGILLALEVIVSMSIYIPIAHFADRMNKKPFVLGTFIFFTLFPIALYFSTSYWLLVIAFVIRGLKEFGEPSRKSLLISLAPDTATASSIGLYYLIRDLIVSSGSFIGAWLWTFGPEYNLITAAGFGAVSVVVFAFGFKLKSETK